MRDIKELESTLEILLIMLFFTNTILSLIKSKRVRSAIPPFLVGLGLSLFLIGSELYIYLPHPYDKLVYVTTMVSFALLVIIAAYLASGALSEGLRKSLRRFDGKMFLITIVIASTYALLYIVSLFLQGVLSVVVNALLVPFHILMGALMVIFLFSVYIRTKDVTYLFLLSAFAFYAAAASTVRQNASFSAALRFMGDLFLLMGVFLSQS